MSSELELEKERTEKNSYVSYRLQIPMEMVKSITPSSSLPPWMLALSLKKST
jgi:hypothetical protein